jgi:outer membrane receptor protein involved in Fe transport
MRTVFGWGLALALSSSGLAAAQTDEPAPAPAAPAPEAPAPDVDELLEMSLEELVNLQVVTASGLEERAAVAAADVTAFTAEDIARHGWRSVAEVLAATPGFYVIDDFVLPSTSVRGVAAGLRSGTRLIKVMVNGVPVSFRPDLTAFLGPEFIPIEVVERIEIAKGPLSALYGANAFLAVVNVITRTWAEGGAELSARLHGGRHHQGQGGTGTVSYVSGPLDVFFAYGSDSVDRSGLRAPRTFEQQTGDVAAFRPLLDARNRSDNDTAMPESMYGQLRLQSDFGRVIAQAGLQDLDSGAEFQLNSLYTHQSRVALRNIWTSLRHEGSWTPWLTSSVWFGWSEGEPRQRSERFYLTGDDSRTFKRHFGYEAIDGLAQLNVTPLQDLTLSAGVDYTREEQTILYYSQISNEPVGTRPAGYRRDLFINPQDPRQVTMSNVGVFAQAAGPLPVLRDLRLTLNLRLDAPGDVTLGDREPEALFPNQTSWRVAAAYEWSERLVTKVLVGEAFQTPSAVLLFARQGFGVQGNVIGSRTLPGRKPLVPQSARSAALAMHLQAADRLILQASAYVQQVKDRIVFHKIGPNFIAQNLEDPQTGAGAELEAYLAFGNLRPYVKGAFHRNFAADDSEPELGPHPELWALAGTDLRVPTAHVNANLEGRWVSERGATSDNIALNNRRAYTLDSYATLDVTLSTYDVRFWRDRETTFILTGRNVTDERWEEPGFGGFDLPTVGRTFMFEIRQAL